MNKRNITQSGFLNLRVLVSLFIVLAGVFLALAALGTFSALAQVLQKPKIITNSTLPFVPNGFDCSKIHELGIDRQLNFRAGAIMIACGQAKGGSAPQSIFGRISKAIKKLLTPLAYGGTDVDLVTGTETYPHVLQSETFTIANPDNPDQIVVAYNDLRGFYAMPPNGSGASVSTDGGNTFTRLTKANGQGPFDNTSGDPVVMYNKPSQTWFTVWLDFGCGGGLGLGGYKSTTPWDPNSWTHYCIHTGSNDDRDSGWADNNPASPFYGRMYVSWNDFARDQSLFVRFSTDNGLTWTNERQLASGGPSHIGNVQITGDLATGDVYVAAGDDGGGTLNSLRSNLIFRSTDGGDTWTNTYTGPSFYSAGRCGDGSFTTMYCSPAPGYWRYYGWGEPAALNGVVHYVYSARNIDNGDPGDVFYIRSTDKGQTFGTPVKLNTDTDPTKAQWEPSLSVSPVGTLLAVWYDEREGGGASTCIAGTNSPCYRMWARKSNDNGVTWLPDDAFADVVSPLPAQTDPAVVANYVGDYDYASAVASKHLASWVDGRVPINGIYQQDAFTDRELVGFSVASADPGCGSVVMTQATDFVVNVTDPVDQTTLDAGDFTVNGTPANSVSYATGATTMTFHYNGTPVTMQGVQTMHIPAGAFNRASDEQPVMEFTCTFRYDTLLLEVTSTNPPAGGAFTGPGLRTYDVNFNEQVDPSSVQTSDLELSGVAATVTNVTVLAGNMTAEFTINFTSVSSGMLTASIPAGEITDQFGNPDAAFSESYNYTGSFCDSGIIQNGGFETGDFTGWVTDSSDPAPVVTNTVSHSGTFSAVVGGATDGSHFCGDGSEASGDSSFYQQFTVPAGQSTLSFWHEDCSTDSIAFDWQDAYITDTSSTILQTIFHVIDSTQGFVNTQVDMTPYAGQIVRVKFLVHQDGFGDLTAMYVDDVALDVPCATPTPRPTPTPRATPTPRPRPTPRVRP